MFVLVVALVLVVSCLFVLVVAVVIVCCLFVLVVALVIVCCCLLFVCISCRCLLLSGLSFFLGLFYIVFYSYYYRFVGGVGVVQGLWCSFITMMLV